LQRVPSLLHGQAEAGRHRRPGRALRAPLRRPWGEEEVATDHRREGLRQAKLRALVRGQWGDADRQSERFPGGAALVEGDRAWIYADEESARALGRGLLWARRVPVEQLHLLVDDAGAAGVLARRAAGFADPPTVWRVDGTALGPASPDPLSPEPPLDRDVEPFADVIRAARADAVGEP